MTTKFWAKTGERNFHENESPKYHPVICHLADTATVAMAIIRNCLSPLAKERLSSGLGLNSEALVKWCGFLAGSHDLGKVSPVFQFQVDEVGQALAKTGYYDLYAAYQESQTKTRNAPHGIVTAKTLPNYLTELGVESRLAKRLAAIVGGHHGFFPTSTEIQELNSEDLGEGRWQKFRQEIYEQLRDFVGLTSEDIPSECSNAAAMILAGLTTTSDWIASNPDSKTGFPYANDMPFEEYKRDLPAKAIQALQAIGWTSLSQGQVISFQELFKFEPRPLQTAAIALSESLEPPCLVLIEASMGEGKTEAALYLADRLQHSSNAGGFYIGLPTQATSNAMWERVRKFLGNRYPQDLVNLTLSHGSAAIQAEYLQSVCRLDQVYDEDAKVVASEWHTARKRTLLSPYGVGTLDQGLMGVVRSRHQFVRLFGLAGRTVIMDEIHAYDLYTSTLLERLLEWLGALGSPAIALSATLPKNTRQKLLSAYAKGCGDTQTELPEAQYPRITARSPLGVSVLPFQASSHVCRSLLIKWIDSELWTSELATVLKDGGCAAVICSTVGRGQAVYQQLQEFFPIEELGLFHGRFLFKDRQRIEKECLDKFGKDSKNRPHRFVLVATQVIEQSLDVDFDLMISDLAPIDLLLQRSGRLHRHSRKRYPKSEHPTLWLIQPNLNEKGKLDFAESGYIYDRHVLLRTWLTLRDRYSVQLPEEMDILIESVYNLESPIPSELEVIYQEDWQSSLAKYRQESDVMESHAKKVRIPPAIKKSDMDTFTRHQNLAKAEDDESTLASVTRLGEPSITVIFLQNSENGLVLAGTNELVDLKSIPNLEQIRAFLNHSTRIIGADRVKALKENPNPPSWKSALLRYCCYVVLDNKGTVQIGKSQLSLDPLLGVVIEKNN
ncbi:MAG: CRISPR-associated helicase Cas3' [Pseudanabaenaceae cyanobacterium bins.68]|nr:CRISPR-associated helicase Cas3' [Pseudanabaenaceae cyanobacterium bins.68]